MLADWLAGQCDGADENDILSRPIGQIVARSKVSFEFKRTKFTFLLYQRDASANVNL